MDASEKCVAFIKDAEGFRGVAYLDSGGVWTLGFGTTHMNGFAVRQGDVIEPVQAEYELREFLRNIASQITASLVSPIRQQQFDACLALAYNIGLPRFLGSTLLKKLNLRDFVGASNEFPKWDMDNGKAVPGLLARRLREQALFNAT